MLQRLSDFVADRKRFYNLSIGLFISATKHCRKMIFRAHIHLTLVRNIKILSRLSDFVTCSERLIFRVTSPYLSSDIIIRVAGSISQFFYVALVE